MTLDLKGRIAVRCRVRQAPIPKTRDPFINTHLLSIGPDADGRERFWTSSCNMVQGTTCVIVNEDGAHRTFLPWVPNWSFYGAVQEDADTLWLCTRMSHVLRFSIRSGRFERFETGGPTAHVGQGMVFDRATGKLLLAGRAAMRSVAVSFDTRRKRLVKLHDDVASENAMCYSFPNGDGTWSIVMATPGQSLLRWDPKRETLRSLALSESSLLHAPLASRLIADEKGRRYIPERGWFNPRSWRLERSGPRPAKEMTWFARRGAVAYGAEDHEGSIAIHAWDMRSGALSHRCDVSDAQVHSCALSRSGKIVVVNVYGVFHRFDSTTGALELSRPLATDAVSHVDCLCRIDRDRLLGTPFITQRFWELNLRTGAGRDCGRAAPGWGEVAQTWKIGGMVYMAAYIGGELTEYDPSKDPRFPENPRVVAKPPRGQRPIAAADDGRLIFYACTRPYPDLGSVLTRYDTQTGAATFAEDPLPDQKICGLAFIRKANALLCGTSMHADMNSGRPASDRCYLARIAADTLRVEARALAPKGTDAVEVIGPLGRGRWLCTFAGPQGTTWSAVDPRALKTPSSDDLHPLPQGGRRIQSAGKPGLFILRVADRIELWDMRRPRRVKTLVKGIDGDVFFVGNVFVQGDSVFLVTPWEIVVLEDVLR